MSQLLADYLYSQLSFSTFKFDEVSFLATKYSSSRTRFFKKYYFKKIYQLLLNEKQLNIEKSETYLINQTITSLYNSSLLISHDQKEIKLYQKIKGKEIEPISRFSIDDLSYENKKLSACLVITDKIDLVKYQNLIHSFSSLKIISLKELQSDEFILDVIKQKLLQDENDLYFVDAGIYSNVIINFVFELNKIGINL